MKYKKVLEMDSKEDEQKESRNIAESEKKYTFHIPQSV